MKRMWTGIVAAVLALPVTAASASAQTPATSASVTPAATTAADQDASVASTTAAGAPKHIRLMPDAAVFQQAEAPSGPPHDFWTARNTLITAGIGAAALAAVMTWHDNHDLGKRKAAILALPPTAIDQWSSEFTAAQNVERSRNFWRSVAIGVGGVTAGYWVTTALEDVSPRVGAPFSVKLPKKGWTVHFDPFNRLVAFAGSF